MIYLRGCTAVTGQFSASLKLSPPPFSAEPPLFSRNECLLCVTHTRSALLSPPPVISPTPHCGSQPPGVQRKKKQGRKGPHHTTLCIQTTKKNVNMQFTCSFFPTPLFFLFCFFVVQDARAYEIALLIFRLQLQQTRRKQSQYLLNHCNVQRLNC